MIISEDKNYTPDEVLAIIGEHAAMTPTVPRGEKKLSVDVDGHPVYIHSMRYKVFFQKGFTCAKCGKVGTHFKLVGDDGSSRRHFELFADDGTALTKDHVIPVNRGGNSKIDNLQPMCQRCNSTKGDAVDSTIRMLTPKAKASASRKANELAWSAHEKARADARLRAIELKLDWLIARSGYEIDDERLLEDMEQSALLSIKPSLSNVVGDDRDSLSKRVASLDNYLIG